MIIAPILARIKPWFWQHHQACKISLHQYQKMLVSQLMTTAVIGITIALPMGFYLFLININHLSDDWQTSPQISLFLAHIDAQAAESFRAKLEQEEDIQSLKFISSDQAFNEYRNLSGFSEALEILESNPLPAVIIITPKSTDKLAISHLINTLQKKPEVDYVQHDTQWLERLLGLLAVVQRFMLILACIFGITVLLVISNTIRMAIFNAIDEIEIIKLFGGSDRFIRRPFLYSGLWHGLLGSCFAWCLLMLGLSLLEQPIQRLSELYANEFTLIGLNFHNNLILFASGISLSLLGSYTALTYNLNKI